MKVRYFADTDTRLIEFRDAPVAESRDLDQNTVLDVDRDGNVCAITIEHASKRADAPSSHTNRWLPDQALQASPRSLRSARLSAIVRVPY